MRLFQVQSRCFTYKKLPPFSSTRFCWRSYFDYYTSPLNRPFLDVGWGEGRHSDMLWSKSRFLFSPSLSSKKLTRALNRTQVIYSCWNLPLPLTKTPYWSPHSYSSLFHPLPWAYKIHMICVLNGSWKLIWLNIKCVWLNFLFPGISTSEGD